MSTIADKLNYVLDPDPSFQMFQTFPEYTQKVIKEVADEMRAYTVQVLPFAETWTDVTTAFETANPNLLLKVYKITHDLAEAPLSSEEQDRLTAWPYLNAWPLDLETMPASQLIDTVEGSFSRCLQTYTALDMYKTLKDPAANAIFDNLKALAENSGLLDLMQPEVDPD